MPTKPPKNAKKLSYAKAGVSIDAGNEFVDFITERVGKTYSDRVVKIEDGFAGMFALFNGKQFSKSYRKPILVAGTDGVGTKLKVAIAAGKHDTVGIDLVAMCVNDLLCIGAEPVFFLDYIGTGKLEKGTSRAVLTGIIEGCTLAGCALLGGETAEMPGMYAKGDYDLAGFAVGVVEDGKQITGEDVRAGDVIIGLPSSGAHSNGFSLVRAALMPGDDAKGLQAKPKALKGRTVGEVLLTPTRIYVKPVHAFLEACGRKRVVSALAHITGGGMVENLERVLPRKVRAVIDIRKVARPGIFDVIRDAGGVDEREMYRVFNMGIGFMVVVRKQRAAWAVETLRTLGEKPVVIGRIEKAEKRSVVLEGVGE